MKILQLLMMFVLLISIPTFAVGSVVLTEYNPVIDAGIDDEVSTDTVDETTELTSDRVDTDNDGFSDNRENSSGLLNQSKKDVVVVLDYEQGIERQDFSEVKKKFDQAPISNPQGTGINLHIIYNQSLTDNTVYTENKFRNVVDRKNNHGQDGFYYGIIVDDIEKYDSSGIAIPTKDSFIIEKDSSNRITQATLMHEIGHVIGLVPTVFDGIDSEYNRDRYNSIMNYNQTYETYTPKYSSGGDFNDWEYIEENLKEENPR